jgi:hypothetical protein
MTKTAYILNVNKDNATNPTKTKAFVKRCLYVFRAGGMNSANYKTIKKTLMEGWGLTGRL